MAAYVCENFNTYIKDKNLQETILDQKNICKPRKLDEYISESLHDSRSKDAEKDKNLEKLQQKVVNIMGPLSRAWSEVDLVKKSGKPANMSVPELSTTIEQAIILTGQVSNVITYQRRSNVLSTLLKDQRKAVKMLKDHKDLFQSNSKSLFGSKLETHLEKKAKLKSKSKDYFKSFQANTNARGRPFSRGPSFVARGGGHTNTSSRGSGFNLNNFNQRSTYRGKGKGYSLLTKSELPQQLPKETRTFPNINTLFETMYIHSYRNFFQTLQN